MPLLPDDLLLGALTARNATAHASPSCGNSTGPCVEVFCGWPLSGQYGFGQRVLYYILVTTCVLARKEKWVRTVCIAAALLVPAVAAVHAIVLAAMHIEDAVDVDIYGALQFCSIGILAGPITVKNSETYFNKKGRNTIFIWTGLILAGLLSLAVEFYRANIVPCYFDEERNPIPTNPRKFPYGGGAMCGLTCSQTDGPSSLLRQKAASEIFVTPRPYTLPFGNAMFLAAACCVPAIISLVTMRNKIVITNWIRRHGNRAASGRPVDTEAAEASSEAKQKGVHLSIRDLLNVVEIFVFGGAVLAIVVIGEINFFSPQMDHHTEPMGSIGQWGTIVATGLAILGSLFIYLVDDKRDPSKDPIICGCEHCEEIRALAEGSDNELKDLEPIADNIENVPTRQGSVVTEASKSDPGYRMKISRGLLKLGKWFDNTTQDPMATSDIRSSQWPHLPGESRRNSRLNLASDQFSTLGEIEPRSSEHSGSEGGSVNSRAVSPSSRGLPEFPSPTRSGRHNSEPSWPPASSSNEPSHINPKPRAATLEIPSSPRRPSRRATLGNRPVNMAPTR